MINNDIYFENKQKNYSFIIQLNNKLLFFLMFKLKLLV